MAAQRIVTHGAPPSATPSKARRGIAVLALAVIAAAVTVPLALEGARKADPATPDATHETVAIKDRTFRLELALDDATRFKGLSGREEIPADGGMLFVFPRASQQQFVMRDCAVPIDIIYLDGTGRVTASHAMQPEPPRTEAEAANNPLTQTNAAYESRLRRYPSRFASQFVIELKGGTLETLKVRDGEKIELGVKGLKKRAS